jgi:hypothetical protein
LKRFQYRWPDQDKLKSFLSNVANRTVGRLLYVPPAGGVLELGGLVYLNNIDSTHVSAFQGLEPIAALSAYGLRELDLSLRVCEFAQLSAAGEGRYRFVHAGLLNEISGSKVALPTALLRHVSHFRCLARYPVIGKR